MRCSRFSLLAVAGVLLLTARLNAQGAEIAPRITSPVNEKSLVSLPGNVPATARPEFDLGPAAPSTQMSHVRLVLARSAEQQTALDQYDAELQSKSSPNYHKWLTPEQFGKLYGPADSDIDAIVAWLEAHGLEVDPVAPGHTNISFSGSVRQIEQLLHTSIHSFQANGQEFLANTTNPRIPSALAAVVSGVAHLNTIRPTPQHVRAPMGLYDQNDGRLKPALSGQGPRAGLTSANGTTLYLVAGDAATIYDTPNSVLNANYPSSSTSYTGKGVTIGIGGDATVNPGTVASYRQKFLGESTPQQPTVSYCDKYQNPPAVPACSGSSTGLGIGTSDQDEAYLDMEISGGLAPSATIHYYASADLWGAIEAAISQNTVDIFSLSFGLCELGGTTSDNALFNSWWNQAEMQGIAVVVSSGDNGSAGCDQQPSSGPGIASSGLMVNGLASTPFNIAVGGTDFAGLASAGNFSTYVLPTNNSATLYRTAIKYIPESTWNDSTNPNTTISANVPVMGPNNDNNNTDTNIVAGSGGVSNCSTNTTTASATGTCTSGYAKPAWQRGNGVPADSARDLPDISLMSGAGGDNAAWLVCTDDQFTQGGTTYTENCATVTVNGQSTFAFNAFGGTSAAAPAFAGILAMVQQKTGGRLGLAAKELYDLYNSSSTNANAIFHDITVGNISVPCKTGSPNCTTNTAGNLFLTGYNTTTGYDLATGLGSVDVVQLVNLWGTALGSGTTTVNVKPSATTIFRTDPLTVVATVQGSSSVGNPTGTVMLSGLGYTSPSQNLTASGTDSATYTFSVTPGSFTKGSGNLTVTYSGDTNYASNTGTAALTVNGLTPTMTITPSATSINSSASMTVTAVVTGTGGTPTGSVFLYYGHTNKIGAGTLDSTGKFTFTIPPFTFPTGGSVILGATYTGDATYNGASSNDVQITVTLSTFTLSATNLTLTAGATAGNMSTVTVTPQGGYIGTVNLTATVTSSPSGAVGTPTLTGSAVGITDANAQTGSITVTTTAPSAVHGNPGSAWFQAAGGAMLAALLFLFLPLGSRRGRRIFSVFLVAVAAAFTVAGCGGGGGSGGGGKTTPSVTVSPSKSSFSTADAISVAVSVSGGTSTATGSVTLTGGGFNSGAINLSAGAATINIPANTFTAGAVTLTASYTGDSNYNAATGTANVTVNKPGTTTGAYVITVTGTDSAHPNVTATTTFTLTVQ